MSTLLLKNLNTLITCNDGDDVLHAVDLYCEDGFIKAIGPDLPKMNRASRPHFAMGFGLGRRGTASVAGKGERVPRRNVP